MIGWVWSSSHNLEIVVSASYCCFFLAYLAPECLLYFQDYHDKEYPSGIPTKPHSLPGIHICLATSTVSLDIDQLQSCMPRQKCDSGVQTNSSLDLQRVLVDSIGFPWSAEHAWISLRVFHTGLLDKYQLSKAKNQCSIVYNKEICVSQRNDAACKRNYDQKEGYIVHHKYKTKEKKKKNTEEPSKDIQRRSSPRSPIFKNAVNVLHVQQMNACFL